MNSKNKNVKVTLVVLGDIGRSPRMQYHALSFAEHNYNVNIIGYGGSKPMQKLLDHPNTQIITMQDVPTVPQLPRLCSYIFKTFWQTMTLLMALIFKHRSHIVMVQNPPAIPTLFAVWFYCLVFRAKFIIDWHNYAHTIMALSLGSEHHLVRLATWIESYFGQKAIANFCVTRAMQRDLLERWRIKAYVLYDRPPEEFKPISLNEKHNLFMRLSKIYPEFSSDDGGTVFTKILSENNVVERVNRPGILVSSTSWTEDEDFGVLLSALCVYEENVENHNLPYLICVITGKGPMKEYYMEKIKKLNLKNIQIITPWLESDDYPIMLAASDLGVSLHISSSGLDLPMKVVDMFGCHLPVCAYDFNCLHELVKNGENSYTFSSSNELAGQIINWFSHFPTNETQKRQNEKFKQQLTLFTNFRWQENWDLNVLPIISQLTK